MPQPMSLRIAFAVVSLSVLPASAATQQECLSSWKTVDVNANGALTADEDKAGYIAAAVKSGQTLLQPSTLSRDEFLKLCADNVFAGIAKTNDAATTPAGPAAARDMGKGDLTPGANPMSEQDARSKLTASGFRDIADLKLDQTGIWRGTAVANGQRQNVAVDAQGDIVAQDQSPTPGTKTAAPTAKAPAGAADTAPAPVATEMVERGTPGRGGMLVWVFLLVGNALALLILSSLTGGGTSAMASRTSPPFA
jgi:hypothetical protein